MDFISNIHKISDSTSQIHTLEKDTMTISGDVCKISIPEKGPFLKRIFIDILDYEIEQLEYIRIYYKNNILYSFDGTYYIIEQTLKTPIQKQKLNNKILRFDLSIIPVLQDMYIEFKIKDQSNNRRDFILECEYIYINQSKNGIYLIEQIQKNIFSGNSTKLKLDFRNSIKEIYVVFGSTIYSNRDTIKSMKLTFNGIDKINDTSQYYRLIQPLIYHKSAPLLPICFYTYSFCLEPEILKPTGTVNFSRIQNILLEYVPQANIEIQNVNIYAKSYNFFVVEEEQGKFLFTV